MSNTQGIRFRKLPGAVKHGVCVNTLALAKPSRGGGALATILAFGLAFVGAFATGACSTVGTVRPTVDVLRPMADPQLDALHSAQQAIQQARTEDSDDDDGDAARAEDESHDCTRVATPESDEEPSPGYDSEADAVRAATAHRKPLPIGAETIHAACPVAWKVMDEGHAWRYLCTRTMTEVLILKSTADAGLTAGTIGNPSAAWVR